MSDIEFITYCIKDPRRQSVIYIGQTNDFEGRRREHLKISKKGRPNIKTENIKTYLWDMITEGLTPEFEILEIVFTLEDSLASETKWIKRYADKNSLLLNRWKAHRAIIKGAR